jgi:DNA-binding HxlR family transcriptional regulator
MSSENRRTESEEAIIRALDRARLEGGRQELSWTELLDQSGLSRRALALRLKSMEKRGLVKRRVDASSGKYPPPVYYRLIQTDPRVNEILSQQKAYDRTVEKELTFEESHEEFIRKLTSKVSPLVIYAILKSMESGSSRPLTDTVENLRFTIKKFLVYKQPFNESDVKVLLGKFSEIEQNPSSFGNDIDLLLAVLKQRFPKQLEAIDQVYVRPAKRKIARGPSLNPRGRPKKSATSQKGNAT